MGMTSHYINNKDISKQNNGLYKELPAPQRKEKIAPLLLYSQSFKNIFPA